MDDKYFYSVSVEIFAPPKHVLEIMTDVENWSTWTPTVKKIKRMDKGPFAVGSKVLISQPKLPPAVWRATVIDEGKGFTWVSTGPGIRVTAHHYIEPARKGSKVTLSIKYSGLFAPLLARLTDKLNKKYLALEAAGLKKQSEETYKPA